MAQPKNHPADELDISDMPELRRIAEEVARSGRPRLLMEDGLAVAEITPASKMAAAKEWTNTQATKHLLAAAGSWADVDTDMLTAKIYADRDRPGRAAPEW